MIGGSLALQALAMSFPPLRGLLGLTPLTVVGWALAAGAGVVPLVLRSLASSTPIAVGSSPTRHDRDITRP